MSTATRRITLDAYHEMADKGLLRPDSKDYLWRGEIVEVMTQKPPHISTLENLADALRDIYPKAEWTVREEKPLPLSDDSEPIPDITVLRGPWTAYYGRYPALADVVLLAEVTHSTHRKDLGDKLAGYAAAGIPLYLVADVESRVVLGFWDPEPAAERYRCSRVHVGGEWVETPRGPLSVDLIFAHLR